ncbi:hypothetical protein [Oryzobacter telluris]|uniref:hypothetical protein n=1 Tax=Oryzobacter telluris TaxID=3149179 RepID=UPI00370D9E32
MDTDPAPEPALAAEQYVDTNADGLYDTAVAANPDGSTTTFVDLDTNGVYETAVIQRVDGSVAAVTQDRDQNGILDVAYLDQTHNGVLDTTMADTTGDNVMDVVSSDLNENGAVDALESTGFVLGEVEPSTGFRLDHVDVGPATNPDPFYTLMLTLAAETGQAVFPPDDSDHDGWPDNQDNAPGDSWRH